MTREERAAENLHATYLALGAGLPGAELRETDGYLALLSGIPHPSGNFALRLRLDPWSAGELRACAQERPSFQVVALDGDAPAHLPELLRRAGFEAVQRLVAMAAPPGSSEADGLSATTCEEEDDRRETARFMAGAFFAREPVALREAIAEALVVAEPIELRLHVARRRPLAAVALSRTEGVLGLYNLAVAASHQGQGLGRALVAHCRALAAAEDRLLVLQCAPGLEGWYAAQGFERLSAVTVWGVV